MFLSVQRSRPCAGRGLPPSRREAVCPPPLSLVVTTDASNLARLGAVLRPHRVLGVWSKKEVLDHI